MPAPTYYSAEMVLSLPEDGNRYETVHGELLVTPSPRVWHEVVLERLHRSVAPFVDRHRIGFVFRATGDISWGPDVLVQPDLYVADRSETRTLAWSHVKTLMLVVEVVSPGTARHDRFTKRKLYQTVGVPLYWAMDADGHYIEAWTPDATVPVVERERVVWQPRGVSESLTINLRDLFKPL